MTKRKSSGTYVIDAGYNIVNFNQTAKELYPSLAIGVKCYEALMQGNSPCATCPVAKGVMGPKRYVDPIRHSWETVDAVELPMPDGSIGHALVFSTSTENERAGATEMSGVSTLSFEEDALTGVYTKHAFYHHARAYMDEDPTAQYVIVLSDIENFKMLNAAFGEEKGDELLHYLGQYYKEKSKGGICGRLTGDEFVVIMRVEPEHLCHEAEVLAAEKEMSAGRIGSWNQDNGTSPRETKNTDEASKHTATVTEDWKKHWIDAMTKEIEANSPIENVIVRYGIYDHIDTSLTMAQICDRAIVAVKSIKHNYQKFYATYDGPVSQRHYRSQLYESKFRDAMNKHEFILQYQPQYDANTRVMTGAEALVRWRRPDGGLIPPGDFLPVFEEDGLIEQLDAYVFIMVLAEQKKLIEQGVEVLPISVNLSRNSMYRSDLADRYASMAKQYGIAPELVPVEITETAMVNSISLKPLAEAFHRAGFALFMDDFGSGRSSLSSLNVLPFSLIKIDKSLVDFIGNPQGNKVIETTIDLAKDLGLTIVAEGVENEAQLEFLRQKGCDIIQGYYFSRPVPVEDFEELLKKRSVPEQRANQREA